jgi:IrrE N-terminal-like domain
MSLKDHKVQIRSKEEIIEIAADVRRSFSDHMSPSFYMARELKERIEKICPDREITYTLQSREPMNPAEVKFSKNKGTNKLQVQLCIDSEIWELACLGQPESREILAHEIGHMVMHSHYALAFSPSGTTHRSWMQQEESAEWQAELFADHLLAPLDMIGSCEGPSDVANRFSVPFAMAERQFNRMQERAKRAARYEGDSCGECGNFTLVRNGLFLKCKTCGSATGSG